MKNAVLVIEDDALIRFIAIDVLEEAGFTVFETDSVLEAVGILAQHTQIGVVFTDFNLGSGPTGLDLAALLSKTRSELGVIVTSGRRRIAKADLPGEACFLSKPYNLEQLVALVQTMMPKHTLSEVGSR